MSCQRELSGDNDYLIQREITTFRTTDGEKIAATGLAGGVGFLAADEGGVAIDASLSVSLTERSGKPGTYYGVIQGDDILAQLADYDGEDVWECVQFGSDYQEYVRVPVRLIRVGR